MPLAPSPRDGLSPADSIGAYNGWAKGLAPSKISSSHHCGVAQNDDYVHQLLNGDMEGVDGAELGTIKNCGDYGKRTVESSPGGRDTTTAKTVRRDSGVAVNYDVTINTQDGNIIDSNIVTTYTSTSPQKRAAEISRRGTGIIYNIILDTQNSKIVDSKIEASKPPPTGGWDQTPNTVVRRDAPLVFYDVTLATKNGKIVDSTIVTKKESTGTSSPPSESTVTPGGWDQTTTNIVRRDASLVTYEITFTTQNGKIVDSKIATSRQPTKTSGGAAASSTPSGSWNRNPNALDTPATPIAAASSTPSLHFADSDKKKSIKNWGLSVGTLADSPPSNIVARQPSPGWDNAPGDEDNAVIAEVIPSKAGVGYRPHGGRTITIDLPYGNGGDDVDHYA